MAQDYLYDVFISYRHKPPMDDWVRNHFYPLLEQWLPECLPIDHEPSIFIDWEMETGTAWPAKMILRAPPWEDWPVLTPDATADIAVKLPRL